MIMSNYVRTISEGDSDHPLRDQEGAPRLTTRSFLPYSTVVTVLLGYIILSFDVLSITPYQMKPHQVLDATWRRPRVVDLEPSGSIDETMDISSGEMQTPADAPGSTKEEEDEIQHSDQQSEEEELISQFLEEGPEERTDRSDWHTFSPHTDTGTVDEIMRKARPSERGGRIYSGDDSVGWSWRYEEYDTSHSGRGAADDFVPGTLDTVEAPGIGPRGSGRPRGIPGAGNVTVTGGCRTYEEVRRVVSSRKWLLGKIHMFHREQGRALGSLTAVVFFTITQEGSVRDCRARTEPTSYPGFERKLVEKVSEYPFGKADCMTDVRWTIRF
jgi:hypothetical protein